MSEEVTVIANRDKYPWSVKTEVVKKYMLLGNMRLISETSNIPYDTLLTWKKEQWWEDLVAEIRKSQKATTNKKLTKIIEETLVAIEDRIENGDYILNNKTGKIERKPVPLRDVANVANQLLTRQLQLEELEHRLEHNKESVQDTLQLLAKEFAKWNRIQNKTKAEDIAYALHDEREEGLQEGSGEIYIEAGSSQEEDGTEQSTQRDDESGQSS